MKSWNWIKYLSTLSLPATAIVAFTLGDIWSIAPVIYAFVLIPLLELTLRPDPANLSAEEEKLAKDNPAYDFMVYAMVVIQYMLLFVFLALIPSADTLLEKVGWIATMGLMCGIYGINVGHELGHRKKRGEQMLAKAALLSSLYMHFFIEHNRGHHKRVATPDDPASARKGEWIYTFWLRSIFQSYFSAWKLENERLRKLGKPLLSLQNEMLVMQIVQAVWIMAIYFATGPVTTVYYFIAAMIGMLLLETVNYIEHYGLLRKPSERGGFERVMAEHSWNSDHALGRIMLFELTRHSDHHYMASRKYQILRHLDDSPQMPTGYPGMMVLSLVPPLWMYVMHKEMQKWEQMKAAIN